MSISLENLKSGKEAITSGPLNGWTFIDMDNEEVRIAVGERDDYDIIVSFLFSGEVKIKSKHGYELSFEELSAITEAAKSLKKK